jgi:DNA repair protein RadC
MQKQNTVAEISVSYYPNITEKPTIVRSEDSYRIFLEFFPEETMHLQERFMVMYLNKANLVLGVYPISSGGITGTVVDVRLILSVALKAAATSLILAHNHPSGNLKPSQNAIELTNKIREAGRYMDIRIVDHLILSPAEDRYFSFSDEGLM